MALFEPPHEPITDGVITMRLSSVDAGDIDAVSAYARTDEQKHEVWLPLISDLSAERSIDDWLEGWAGRHSHNGPTLVVTIPDVKQFIGIVGFSDRNDGVVEMIYGIAPKCRGRGLASRAARLGALWALNLLGVTIIELRIDRNEIASQHVALNAGFVEMGTVYQFVPGTGMTFEDLRYVLPSD
jgi:RimJ/RimL family protein N-acetyltransferase